MFFDYIKGFEVVYDCRRKNKAAGEDPDLDYIVLEKDCGLDYIIFKYGQIEEDRE